MTYINLRCEKLNLFLAIEVKDLRKTALQFNLTERAANYRKLTKTAIFRKNGFKLPYRLSHKRGM